jgi:hypothetical protein
MSACILQDLIERVIHLHLQEEVDGKITEYSTPSSVEPSLKQDV